MGTAPRLRPLRRLGLMADDLLGAIATWAGVSLCHADHVRQAGREEAAGVWEVAALRAVFQGDILGNPLVPGVLLTEALAQMSGLAGAVGGKGGMLAQADMRFQTSGAPPATIVLRSKLSRVLGELQQFEVSASVGNDVVASGTITLHRPQ